MHTFTRALGHSQLETRSGAASGDGLTLHGYAATFNDPTEIRDYSGTFMEQIAPGAFTETLAAKTPILQWNHGHDPAVGQVTIGVFTAISEDRQGLKVEARLHDNPSTLPVRQAIASGAVTGMSFKFQVVGEYWRDASGTLLSDREVEDLLWRPGNRGPLQRTITAVRLHEAGPVSTPAYKNTSVGVRDDLTALSLQILRSRINHAT